MVDENRGTRGRSGPSEATGDGSAGRLDDQLCFALYAATNAMTRTYRPLLDDLGLTYSQYLVLLVLWEHGSRSVGDIATDLRLATHAVSPIADRLEASGLVRRTRDDADGRVVRLELTEAGADLEAKVPEVQEHVRCRTALDDENVVRLQAELLALADQLNGG